MSDIYEQKPWLNDDPQTVETLKKNLGIDGGSGLPEIGSGDDGKVLTANVSGDTKTATWETPSSGGGDNLKYYQCTLAGTGYTLHASITDLTTDLNSGKTVYTIGNQQNTYYEIMFLSYIDVSGETNYAVFTTGGTDGSSASVITRLFKSENDTDYMTWTYVPG